MVLMGLVKSFQRGCWGYLALQPLLDHGGYCFTNCTSPLILTSSLTITPPASSAAFQFNPQSLRLNLPLMENPAFSFPQGSFAIPPNSTLRLISFVTPLMVRSPFN